ncbi:MAG: extracellular solute-binding protein [Clostridia bacterium]|nr:extracellular solute-binding protein [Clostridia bacterium]
MKRIIACILALVMMILPLTACSKDSGDESYYSYYYEYEDVSDETDGEEEDETSSKDKTSSSNKGGTTSTGKDAGQSSSELLKKDFDLKGKTVTMAITEEDQYNTTSFKAMISAFQTKYGCKVKTHTLQFSGYNTQVSQRMSTGDPYDICYVHGNFFPAGPIAGCYADLTDAMNNASFKKQVDLSGINMEKTNKFLWDGKLYGVCDNNCAFPDIFYYNKALFQKAELEDPRTLYNNGQWTWAKVFEQGKEVTDASQNIYYLASFFVITQTYGKSSITVDDGKPVLNLKAPETVKALELIQKIYNGNDAIGEKMDGSDHTKSFIEGRNYVYFEESSKYPGLVAQVKKSMAFGKKVENLEIVPIPLIDEDGKQMSDAYPTGWYTSISAGNGSDPRIALAWAAFEATYKSTVKGSNEYDDEDQALIDKIMAGKTIPNRHGGFTTSSASTVTLHDPMIKKVRDGEDIAKVLDEYYPQYQACIDETVNQSK